MLPAAPGDALTAKDGHLCHRHTHHAPETALGARSEAPVTAPVVTEIGGRLGKERQHSGALKITTASSNADLQVKK